MIFLEFGSKRLTDGASEQVMTDQLESKIVNLYVVKLRNSPAIAYRDVGNEREQGHGSVTRVPLRPDLFRGS